jgi:fatty-acyl-CoA synthase
VDEATLPHRIARGAERAGSVVFVGAAGGETRVAWAQLYDEARQMAAALGARGVGPGTHVAVLAPTGRLAVTALEGVWLAGAAAVMLPLPMRLGSVEEFLAQTRARLRRADATLLVLDPALAAFVEPVPGDPPVVGLDELAREARRTCPDAYEEPALDPSALAILQYTSGSTSDPKGVMLPHRNVVANLDAIVPGAAFDPERDVTVSWLPLYHDMGLIGCLLVPMTTGGDLVLGSPQDFLASPARWLEWLTEFGGTATAGPNFAYALAARALRRGGGYDLSRWRLALNGAEPIDPGAVEAFCEAGAPYGLDARAAFCAFGMAEATLAVTFPEPFSGLSTDVVERAALEHDAVAVPADPSGPGARRLARLGRPIGDLEVRIVDPANGGPRGEREVGELEIRGSSVTPGYYAQPTATAEAFHDGWLRTGDLAYLAEGELVVCGRLKDVIIVGGRNVYPEDVERAAAAVPGVRPGNVIAFGVEGRKGREALVVVAEVRPDAAPEDAAAGLRRAVAERVRESVGLSAEDIVLVEPGTLPKTSSGKLQRSLCRKRYLESELAPA